MRQIFVILAMLSLTGCANFLEKADAFVTSLEQGTGTQSGGGYAASNVPWINRAQTSVSMTTNTEITPALASALLNACSSDKYVEVIYPAGMKISSLKNTCVRTYGTTAPSNLLVPTVLVDSRTVVRGGYPLIGSDAFAQWRLHEQLKYSAIH